MEQNDRGIHKATDVFTPGMPATLTFVERIEVNNLLIDALSTPGKQIVVYGPSQSGKTTLLTKVLGRVVPGENTRSCERITTFEMLIKGAFDELRAYYVPEITSHSKKSLNATLCADYRFIKLQLDGAASSDESRSLKRVVSIQLTPQRLGQFLGEAEHPWVIDDFHKVSQATKRHLADAMKIFCDMAKNYEHLRIIAIGAAETARQVVECDPNMRNRVAEIRVPLMTEGQIRQIVEKGEHYLKVRAPEAITNGIVRYSNGMPLVCHQLCLNMCHSAGITHTRGELYHFTGEDLKDAVISYVKTQEDTLQAQFDVALKQHRKGKYHNCELILESLSRCANQGATHAELLELIRERERDYPAGNLTAYLKELQTEKRSEFVRFDRGSGRYSFVDPIYLAYCSMYFDRRSKPAQHMSLQDMIYDIMGSPE